MRFVWKCKVALKTLSAVCLCAVTVFVLLCINVCRLSQIEGERVFYLHSASSQGLRMETLGVSEIFDVRGESVRFVLEVGCDKEALAREIAKGFGAEIVLVEKACGAVSYYAYTPEIFNGIRIEGKIINLHIALGEEMGAVGTPIVFGGF